MISNRRLLNIYKNICKSKFKSIDIMFSVYRCIICGSFVHNSKFYGMIFA